MSPVCDISLGVSALAARRHAGDGVVSERRPLTARQVVASTLLGVDPPRLPAQALVRSGELFGLRPGATRTALSRMAAAGEVVADDGRYVLVGPLLERHGRQQAARHAGPEAWDGGWVLVVVDEGRRSAADRSAFRDAARRWKLGEVREGCWARPDNLPDDRSPAARAVLADQATFVRDARPDDVAPFLAALDTDGWAATARALIDEMEAGQPALDARRTEVLGTTFETAAAVLRHLVADPALPPALRPEDWPADDLRAVYDRFDAGFSATWRDWYRSFARPD